MRARRLLQDVVGVAVAAALFGCGPTIVGDKDSTEDIDDALAALPNAEVLAYTFDGVPLYIVGEMAKVGAMQTDDPTAADQALRPMLAPVLAPFRLSEGDLRLRKMNVDDDGNRHFRYVQTFDGLDVIGGDLVVHVDVKGAISGINGSARGDLPGEAAAISGADAVSRVVADARFDGLATASPREVFMITPESTRHRAYEVIVEGQRGPDPARDKVYVDAANGDILAVHPTIHFAENRRVYSANNGTSLPGTLRRSEGQAATTDTDVNAAYDNTGNAYEAYNNFWGRDSYNNAGAQLTATVHYSNNYCNAFWNGTQMVYGDGNGASCLPLARSNDVTAHELTHAVTENESGLIYSGESGGINESYSDIFGAFVEAWTDGGKNGTLTNTSDVWLIGDEILPPYLRNMCDPLADGVSKDLWYSGIGSVDVHYSSGVSNLAFCLLSKGGTHPRGKTTVNVPGIGMANAIRIFYKAQVDILTPSSNFAALRTATGQAATQLGMDSATVDAVGCAWAAVGVGTGCGGSPPPPPPPGDGVLTNNVAVTGLADSTVGNMKFWKLDVPSGQSTLTFTITGGTGDADMYVQFGSKPSQTVYQCRPYKNGNNETCTFTPPTAGTYWVGLRAYSAYAGVTLKGVYSSGGGGGGDPYLSDGVPVTSISGSSGNQKYWRIAAPGGVTVSVQISGGSGDADLYTRFGQRPTTSSYSCRPYKNGNNETCNLNNAAVGDHYVMLRAYSSYSGVSLVASW
jgi:vibriolysin